jgi:CHAT domain-containing protein
MRLFKVIYFFLTLLIFINLDFNSKANTPSTDQISDKDLVALIDKVPPPPKNINDVIKLLDNSKSDIQAVEKYKQIASSKPDPSLKGVQLFEYHQRQFEALEQLGLVKELEQNCLRGIEIAKELYKELSSDAADQIYFNAETNCLNFHSIEGDRKKALERIEPLLKHPYVQKMSGWELTLLYFKIDNLTLLGDLNSAQEAVKDVDRLIGRMRGFRSWPDWSYHWTYQAEQAKGNYFMLAGKPQEAELNFVRALNAMNTRIKYNNQVGNDPNAKINQKEQMLSFKAYCLATVGISLQSQRKLVEAEYYLRESLKIYLSLGGKNSSRVARAVARLSQVVTEQGRFEEGNILAQYSLKSNLESGLTDKSLAVIQSKKAVASTLVNVEKYSEALNYFSSIRTTIQSDEFLKKHFGSGSIGDLDEVIALIFTKNYTKAETLAQSIFETEKNKVGPTHPRTVLAQGFYAVTLNEQKKSEEAKKNFKTSIPILIEQVRNDSETTNISQKAQRRFALIAESYMELLFAEAKLNKSLENNLASEAFLLADLARGSSVQKALSQSTARSSSKDKRLLELARTEQDLQRRINSLNELLLNISQAGASASSQDKIRNDISNLRAERNSVKKDIESRYPEYFDLVEPKPITIERTAKILNANEVLITWYFGERQSFIWAIHQSGLSNFSTLSVTKKDIAKDVNTLRKALDPGVGSVDEIPAFDVVLSNKLYNQIIKPIEQSLTGKNLLISVPHESLGQLPISVLLTEKINQPPKGSSALKDYQNAPWLIRKIAISQLPSVNALASLRGVKTEKNNNQSFIAFADPYFSKAQATAATKKIEVTQAVNTRGKPLNLRSAPKTSKVSSAELALLPALPDTSIEVNEIAKVLNAKPEDIFLNQHASVKKVLETDFSKKSIVMFSTHGLVPGELNGLTQPALALSSPEVTGEKDSDGLLTMDKILELKLNADWVVLSACNTASSDSSSEAVSGLGRAFFYAGARALLVSNWPVDTVSSRDLMVDLFKRQNNQEKIAKPEALKQAMLNIADKGAARIEGTNIVSYFYSHPLFWAPFVIVGD